MLLILMYHRINNPELFCSFIENISQNHPVVLPGDALQKGELSICLTFDDGYFDFYHYVFPFLLQKNIKAVLGVPVKFIMEKTIVNKDARLNVPYDEAMRGDVYKQKAPFCTWHEIKEMAESGFVKLASHSKNHVNLAQGDYDLDDEIIGSKKAIEKIISHEVDTFIYPYGKVDNKVHSFATQHYKYLMRIGSALNRDWHNSNNMLYRVNGDEFLHMKHFNKIHLFKYYLKYLSNIIRKK